MLFEGVNPRINPSSNHFTHIFEKKQYSFSNLKN